LEQTQFYWSIYSIITGIKYHKTIPTACTTLLTQQGQG